MGSVAISPRGGSRFAHDFFIDVGEVDRRPIGHQPSSDGFADAARGARDERDLSGEVRTQGRLPRRCELTEGVALAVAGASTATSRVRQHVPFANAAVAAGALDLREFNALLRSGPASAG